MKNAFNRFLGFLSGVANGIFGSGGGILAVDYMKRQGLSQKKAQATALCATWLMSVFSTGYYLYNGFFNLSNALLYIPFGIPGALTGSFLLKKLPDKFLKKVFGVFIIWAGLRMIIR